MLLKCLFKLLAPKTAIEGITQSFYRLIQCHRMSLHRLLKILASILVACRHLFVIPLHTHAPVLSHWSRRTLDNRTENIVIVLSYIFKHLHLC